MLHHRFLRIVCMRELGNRIMLELLEGWLASSLWGSSLAQQKTAGSPLQNPGTNVTSIPHYIHPYPNQQCIPPHPTPPNHIPLFHRVSYRSETDTTANRQNEVWGEHVFAVLIVAVIEISFRIKILIWRQ